MSVCVLGSVFLVASVPVNKLKLSDKDKVIAFISRQEAIDKKKKKNAHAHTFNPQI